MGTAITVPETERVADELSGDDAAASLRRVGPGELLKESVQRYRDGDGASSARALAYQLVLTTIPLAIAVVGLSSAIHAETLSKAVRDTITSLAPGPGSDVLTRALEEGAGSGGVGGILALVFGLLSGLASLAVGLSQIERGANRLYGLDEDRTTRERYLRGAVLGLVAGLPALVGFVVLVAGRATVEAFGEAYGWSGWAVTTLAWLRWPLGALLCWIALTAIFKQAPNREQPGETWLAFGAGLALVLWLVFSGLLALYVATSSGFGQLYGPLTGVIALLLWAQFTAVALFLGLAAAAQLEYERSTRRARSARTAGA